MLHLSIYIHCSVNCSSGGNNRLTILNSQLFSGKAGILRKIAVNQQKMNLDIFGQIVIGPPGSGKTTYCHGMQQILNGIGRKAVIVNMDPANDALPYECAIDIAELITLSEVMDKMNLGPNGGLVYCMEYLETNLTWLIERLRQQCSSGTYVIIDCPGQVELYTHHQAVRNIVERLMKLDFRLCAVHLVDSHNCTDPAKFIAVLLTSLATMLQIELPLVNVLSKADLIEKQHKLQFNVDFYTDVLDLNYLLDLLSDDPFTKKHKKLNAALVGLIESYSLVSFNALDIQNKESVLRVLTLVDKANGYIFGSGEERNIQNLLSTAIGADSEYFKAAHVQERNTNP